MSEDAFEFYPCLIDGKPASIFVNVRFEADHPEGAETRYQIGIRMRDVGPHGIGVAAEAEVLNAFEEKTIERLATSGLLYAGRVRSDGIWESTFYGPANHDGAVRDAASALSDHSFDIQSQPDAEWRYYVELLLPDDERRQWIDDRRLCTVLREQGDIATTPRRVDHWATFATADARDGFVATATAAGFTAEEPSSEDGAFGAQVYRTDPVELDHIHEVVMTLVDAAKEHGGDYDGWETSIES